jgi:hypothetical protein
MQSMPSFTESLFIAAFSKMFAILHAHDYQPAQNVMNNECSKVVEKHIQANKMDTQLGHRTVRISVTDISMW